MLLRSMISQQQPLDTIDLSVNSGEFVYLVGPSGAGKSSLIRLFYQEEKLNEWFYEGWRV